LSLEVRALRCEYRDSPAGIGEPVPRLAWKLAADERGQAQTAYRIRVDEESATGAWHRVWDTGWVDSPEHLGVEYGGAPLRSTTRYRWEVRLRDARGIETDTAESTFSTGILHPGEWRARWIGRDPNARGGMDVPQDRDRTLRTEHLMPPLQLRRRVELARLPRRAHVHITARGLYRLRVNGTRVGADELTPGWTDYRYRLQYQTYDITGLLTEGENVLAAVVSDGWWCGYIGFDARHQALHYGTAPQLFAQLVLDHEDGSQEVVVTDGQWRERPGAIQYADLLMGEQVDARAATTGWSKPGFDDSAWPGVIVHGDDTTTLTATSDEPVRVTEELPARELTVRPGGTVVDFGQNMVGHVRLTVRNAERGQRIQLRHAEILADDGAIYTENLRSAETTDIYYAAGDPVEVFEPALTTHGFRYAEISGYPGTLEATDVTGVVVHSDTPFTGRFDCDDELVNRLQANIVRGQRGNFVSVPTDCPQRDERLGWLADAHIFAPTASLNADTAAFYARWLHDVRSGQNTDGAFPDVAPKITQVLSGGGAPAWGDGGVLIPWLLWRHYSDRRALEASFPGMCAWVDYIRRFNPDLVWRHRRGNDYGDWLQVDAATPPEVVATAYFARSARTVALAAEALGRSEAAHHYGRLADDVATAFTAEFAEPAGGLHGDTQTAYLVALAFDLLPDRLVTTAVDRLTKLVTTRGNRLTTGFLGVALLAPTLAEHGRADLAHALLVQTGYPSWGYSIVNGATTIWERWDGWTAEHGTQSAAMNSFNHYSLGSVGEWLYRGVAGLDQAPGSVAWADLAFRPRPGGNLTRASAEYDSVRGLVGSGWRIDGEEFRFEVLVPPGAGATVTVPTSQPDRVRESDEPVENTEGIRDVEFGDGELRCRVGPGRYIFTAPRPH
jgi:alpha-L-rhamnosidase